MAKTISRFERLTDLKPPDLPEVHDLLSRVLSNCMWVMFVVNGFMQQNIVEAVGC